MVQGVNQTLNRSAAAELRAYLARNEMTIAEGADKIGASHAWLARRLNGTTPTTLDDLERICTAFGIPISQVIRPTEDVA
jgi:transcriptional regulator with XRE-family HTH domain